MLSLGRVNRALDLVRSGKVVVDTKTLDRLLNIYIDVHSTEFFDEKDMDLVKKVEHEGHLNGTYSRRTARTGGNEVLRH